MADQPETTSSVFISYSRRNKEFAQKLNASLDNSGVDAWVDWEGIPLSSDWMDEITRAIEGADAFLFIITPDSLASKVCEEELLLGLKYNKKLIPILYIEPEKDSTMHESLAATNWVYMREQDDYDATLPALIETIHTDLEWVREHTRLLERAREWEDEKKNSSFLLRGSDLDAAESWMVKASEQTGREVVPLQGEYIQASRVHATQKQRNLLIGVSLALVVSIGLAIFALIQRGVAVEQTQIAVEQSELAKANEAVAVANEHARATQQVIAEENEAQAIRNEVVAKAQRAAAEARIYQTQAGELDTSTLLAIDSWQRYPSFIAEDILRRNTSISPLPVSQVFQGGRIWRIKRSPDGDYFATASGDATVCLWAMEGATKEFCVEHDDAVYDILFSLDGKILITAGEDGTVRLWDAGDGSLLQRYDFNGAAIRDIDLRPDNTQVAVARDDGFVSLINLENLEESPSERNYGSAVTKVVYSPNNIWLGIGTAAGETYIWNLENAYFVITARHTGEVLALDFSPNSEWIVSGGADSMARLHHVDENGIEAAVMAHGDWIEFIDFGPTGEWFVTASDDNNLRVWDVATGTEKLRMEHDSFVLRTDISDNGAWLASTGYDQTARVWDSASGSEMMQIPLDARGTAVLFNEDGSLLIVGDKNGETTLWDTSSLLARLNTIQFPELVGEAHYSPDGNWLAVNTDRRDTLLFPFAETLEIKDGTEGSPIIQPAGITYDLVISPNSEWVAVTEHANKRTILYHMTTQETTLIQQSSKVYDLAFSPDNTIIVSAGQDGFVRFWDLETTTEIAAIENPVSLQSIAYNPSGTEVAAGMKNQIIIWDVESKEKVITLTQTGDFHNIAYSNDGHWLATASSEGSIQLWDAKNGYALSPHILRMNGQPYGLEFSPDSSLLAGGSTNYFAYLWDVSLGEEISRIPHSDVVTSVSFSADGLELATVSRKTVQIWDIPALPRISTDSLIDTVCSHLTANLSQAEWDRVYENEEYRLLCPNLETKK